MYTEYWNLREAPFLNTIDRRFLFTGEQQEEVLARFAFLTEGGRLAGLLTGPYGVGKTTLLRQISDAAEARNMPCIRMDAIPGGQLPMVRQMLELLRIEGAAATLPDALMCLWTAARNRPNAFTRTLLCIDEAHTLAQDNGLYLAHYLTNLRLVNARTGAEEPMFTLILAGAPALLDAVRADPSLSQRMQIVCALSPLTAADTAAYVQHHMRAAGGDLWAFTQEALDALHAASEGIPRKINLLCDVALMLGFAARVPHIDAGIVRQAATDTGILRADRETSHVEAQHP